VFGGKVEKKIKFMQKKMVIKLKDIAKKVLEAFPDANAGIVFGSLGNDYNPGISDIDILIVGRVKKKIQDNLKLLVKSNVEFDPVYISEAALNRSVFKGKKPDTDYELHSFCHK
jgi:predicted nucleotidyltransferase